jgi:hypothetical protein
MFNRLETEQTPKSIPQDWLEGTARLLNETYKRKLKEGDYYFDTFGQIFPEELIFIVSLLPEEIAVTNPVTLFLSCDKSQMDSEKKVKETQKSFIELTGLFFDEIFASEDWNEFEPTWQEVEHENQKYFFKISRENINLTLEANKLLGDI